MLIAYYSLTGKVRSFAHKLGRPGSLREIQTGRPPLINEPYVLITPTIGRGEVPPTVAEFVAVNADYLRAVAASGNRNFAANFARAADVLAERYNVPVLLRFELAGNAEDVRKFNEGVDALSRARSN